MARYSIGGTVTDIKLPKLPKPPEKSLRFGPAFGLQDKLKEQLSGKAFTFNPKPGLNRVGTEVKELQQRLKQRLEFPKLV